MNFFSSFFYNCDIFKTPVYLRFNSKIKISSPFSSLVSIGIILFMCIYFFQSDIFAKQNPNSSIQSIAANHRPSLDFDFNNQNLAFGFAAEDNTFLEDNSIFYFSIKHNYYSGSGDLVYTDTKSVKKCEEKEFRDYGTLFGDLGLGDFLCLDKGNFSLEGYWDEKFTKYLEIDIKRCRNESSNNTCKSEEEIQKFFSQNIYLNVYFSDNIIDANNFKEPIKNIYKNRFFLMDRTISKKITFYFKKVELTTDDGVIFSNDEQINSFMLSNFEVDYISGNDEWIASILFYSSSDIYVVKRRYQKLQEFVANLGGLINFLLIIGYFLTYLEKEYIYFKNIINVVEIDKKMKDKQTFSPLKSQFINFSNVNSSIANPVLPIKKPSKFQVHQVEKPTVNTTNPADSNKKTKRNQWENWKKFFLAKQAILKRAMSIVLYSSETDTLSMNFIDFVKFKFKPSWKKLTNREVRISKALQTYKNEIDILNIISKLQDLEKMKKIINNSSKFSEIRDDKSCDHNNKQ